MTDWYLGHEVGGDLIVPEDQVYFDRLPSPDSWSHWGICGWQNNSDIQCINLTGSDSIDDMFLSSLIHDDVTAAVHDRNPVGCSPQYRYDVEPAYSDSAERMMDFQSISSHIDGVGSSNYFRTPPFSPSAVSDNGHYSSVHNSYDGQSVQELDTMKMLLSDQEPECEHSSIEESVLLGLEDALNKLSSKTRLCFRDSFYRLALRSEPQMSEEVSEECLPFDRPALLETADTETRCAKTVTAESETNTIDRAVANLMFEMMDADEVDRLPSIFSKFDNQDNAFGATRACNYGSFQAELFSSPKPAESSADFEVPVFSL